MKPTKVRELVEIGKRLERAEAALKSLPPDVAPAPAASLARMLVAVGTAIWVAPCAILVCLLMPRHSRKVGAAFVNLIETIKGSR